MWTPTHVQVTVQRAKGLLLKGKNGTNDAFVTISLGKEKYQTSVKERATESVDWHEECELAIPRHGNKAEIVLTLLHRNFIGDEFLGQISIPLSDFDVYDKPKNRWYSLKCKPGQDKSNYRGEIEVRVSFTVQSGVTAAGSLTELKKDGIRASFGQLSQKVGSSIGGSLLSLKGKDKKGLKSFAKAVGNKVSTLPGRGHKKRHDDNFGAIPEQQTYTNNTTNSNQKHPMNEADPGVISDDEDEFRFDELSHKSSHSSLSVSQVALSSPRDGSLENLGGGEFLRRNYATPPPVKPKRASDPPPEKPERWSTGPIDDWETKLFGKQNMLDKASSLKSVGRSSIGSNNGYPSEKEEVKEDRDEDRASLKSESAIKPTFQSIFTVPSKEKEPVPKPRQSPIVTKPEEKIKPPPVVEDLPKPAPKPTKPEKVSKPEKVAKIEKVSKPEKVVKAEKESREPEKPVNGVSKEIPAPTTLVTPTKNLEEEVPNQKWTPVGITNPIRQKDSHQETRLPREILKKFENKSREDLIELIMKQQTTLEYQKHKLNDMEDYIDNLLVRVMEVKPTLLQTPYVTNRPMK
ncbi:unnamed protein product [Orchesella dallaii]|uniref:Rab11 family-interacting protein 1 n=1 Tax=Orchesella dallaii TaxID=48710 RepID=A0ABP1QN89_9HEXA